MKNKKWTNRRVTNMTLLVMMLFVALWLAGCGQETTSSPDTNGKNNQETSQTGTTMEADTTKEEVKSSSFPVTITDKTGTKVTIEKEPQRIISIIPSTTETAFALGLGDKIVGVSKWDNYPEEVKEKTIVGELEVNLEKVLELQPDLVIGNLSNGKSIEVLRKAGVTVFIVDANTLEETYESIKNIGLVTGRTKEAEEIIARMDEEKTSVVEAVKNIPQEKRKKVWIEVSPDLYTAGSGTFMNELLTLAGGINVAADQSGWVQLSEETVIERSPEVIFTTYGYYVPNAAEQVKARSGWNNVPAVQNGQIFDLNSDLVNRPGPRVIQGLVEMAKFLYPELVK
ncbi:ABC transporter substrate-binding protein [Microaerobacter geothermalis]|uniref:ABC transporter substrate-binding protein n=1 Tax=Microaerobacter geothermalis TaxID=674972 RepID=UPI001F2ADFA0|nr:ABC transporter substrate-binding protein [Microaerobacter geothermalis]MCF6093666.1 ABC transporter substrate-binding protein [Microaerobacter geothermalis]